MSIAYTDGAPVSSPDGGTTTAFRFQRPVASGTLGAYFQPGQPFSSAFSYTSTGRDLDRSGLLLARGPAAASRSISTPALRTPDAVHDARLFGLRLPAHGQASLTWQIPLEEMPAGSASDSTLAGMSFAAARGRLQAEWKAQEVGMMRISVPESKVSAAYEAAIAEILDSRLHTSAGVEQTPNRLQYQAFWIRDAAIETQALDLAGLHLAAAQNLAFIDAFQNQSGLFISQPEQYDELGQALWALSQHAQLAREPAYATQQLPLMQAAIGWLSAAVASDPLGLLPAATPGDNELASGHITGDDLWAADRPAGRDRRREARRPRRSRPPHGRRSTNASSGRSMPLSPPPSRAKATSRPCSTPPAARTGATTGRHSRRRSSNPTPPQCRPRSPGPRRT